MGHLLFLTGRYAAGVRRKVEMKNEQPFLAARLRCHCRGLRRCPVGPRPQTLGGNIRISWPIKREICVFPCPAEPRKPRFLRICGCKSKTHVESPMPNIDCADNIYLSESIYRSPLLHSVILFHKAWRSLISWRTPSFYQMKLEVWAENY